MRRRIDLRSLLANPDERRELMVGLIVAISAREGITRAQAERAYDTVVKVLPYLFPEITRGPGNTLWLVAMKNLGRELGLEPCEPCAGCWFTGYSWDKVLGES